jgi:hypothetical protein
MLFNLLILIAELHRKTPKKYRKTLKIQRNINSAI